MKTSEELIAIKMCIKTISMKVKRLENITRQLKKQVEGNQININGKYSKRLNSDHLPLTGSDSVTNLRNLILQDD